MIFILKIKYSNSQKQLGKINIFEMNDLRLLLQADKDRKIINLQFKQITNLQLMMPILSKFQNLESLSLSGNRLQNLPNDMGSLEKLTEFDISNNLFRDITDILPTLKSIPRLSHLIYTFKNETEEQLLRKELSTLERLNKKPISTNQNLTKKNQKSVSSVMKLNEKDLQEIAQLYDDIRDVYKRSKYFVDKELADQFDKSVDNIMGDLSNKLGNAVSEEDVNSSIVTCRYALIDLCFVKLITYFYHFDKNVASVIERIHDYMADSFKSMHEILKNSTDKSKSEIAHVVVKKEELYKTQIKRLKHIQESHLNQISILELKNAELLEKITKNGKKDVLETTINNVMKRRSRSPINQKYKETNGSSSPEIQEIKFNKTLTLNQLKEVINEIYSSKQKHNSICYETGQQMQTLETHMYTFLNQKYGLKPITVEWAMSIVNGIKRFGSEDIEVAAFGKVLRNEIEEDFADTLKKVKINLKQNFKKFKSNDDNLITPHEAEEVLLFCNFKRDAITSITSRVIQTNLINGCLSLGYLQYLTQEYVFKKHDEKTRKLVTIFREVDIDEDGIIDHDALLVIIDKIDLKKVVTPEEFLEIVDPYQTNCITFSHLCTCLQANITLKDFFDS